MEFQLDQTIDVLRRSPSVLKAMLRQISVDWQLANEGEGTWNPYDIVGHLIHGEKTDWIRRAEIILSDDFNKEFKPFDRQAQFKESRNKSIEDLLDEFESLRNENLRKLEALNIQAHHLQKTGIHPDFGEVNLEQLLSTWLVHDLGHIAQVTRVMAKQYKENIGPWKAYLPIVS